MSDLHNLSVKSLATLLQTKEVSAVEVATRFLARMGGNPHNAFLDIDSEVTLAQAQGSDTKLAAGTAGPLEGVPVAHKDVFVTQDFATTAGSKILSGYRSPFDATVVQRLRTAGMVTLGKLNCDEFAMGSANENSAYGAVSNPWDAARVPGGSSGGSAAAVAAGLAPAATGTDTGGSIRQPASFCGITGIKPTYGRCSRWGIVAFASSLDQAGPVARTVEDCAILLQSMSGFDPKDSTSADLPVPDFAAACKRGVKGLRIGVPREYRSDDMPPEIETMWQQGLAWLREQGAEIVDVSLPHTKYGLATYYIVAPAEASSNLARYDGVRFSSRTDGADLNELYENTRAAGFGPEVKRRIMIGTYVLSAGYYDAYYLRAQKIRALILKDFTDVFQTVDALVTPTAPSAAFAQGEKMDDPLKMYFNDVFTVPANMSGIPGMSVPAGLDAQGLPLGLQVLGRPFDEETVFAVGAAIERAAGFTALPGLRAGGGA